MSIVSPLTGLADVELYGRLQVSDLVKRYRQIYGIDVSRLTAGLTELSAYRCLRSNLIFFNPPVSGDGSFYEALQHFDWYYEEEKSEFAASAVYVPEGARVLEIGCGSGAFAAHLPGRLYRALEFNDAALARARARGLDVTKRSIEEVAEAGEQYDVICAFQVLEHVERPREFLEAARRALAPGGRAIFAVPDSESMVSAPGLPLLLNMPPHHLTWWSEKTMRWIGSQPGWRLHALEHEILRSEHNMAFVETLIWTGLRRSLGREPGPLEVPSPRDPVRIASRLLAAAVAPALSDRRLRPRGHTITAVLDAV